MSTNSAEQIKSIVSHLKAPPFSLNFTLLSFSQLTPLELLQIVRDAFAQFDPRMQGDLRDEASDVSAHKMIDFLVSTLDYHVPGADDDANPSAASDALAEFGTAFMSAQPSTIYPVLLYVLNNQAVCAKRAYLARYLGNMSVPPELMSDGTLYQLYASLQAKQTEFKAVHQRVEMARATASKPAQLKQEVEQLENEKDQLESKLAKLKAKIQRDYTESNQSGVNQFDEMLRLTNLLRLEQEEESKIYQSVASMKEKKTRLECQLQLSRDSLAAVRAAHGLSDQENNQSINPLAIFARLRQEINQHQSIYQATEHRLSEGDKELRSLLHQTNTQSNEWKNVATSETGRSMNLSTNQSVHEDLIADLQHDVRAFAAESDDMEEQLARAVGGPDSAAGFLRDRLSAIAKKKEKLNGRVKEFEAELAEIDAEKLALEREIHDMEEKRAQAAAHTNSGLPKSEAEFQVYLTGLAEKTNEYKAKKWQLDSLHAELEVLASTHSTLQGRIANLEEYNTRLEKQTNLSGYRDKQNAMKELTKSNNQSDQSKKLTLDEISRLVEQIDQAINRSKAKLAPQIRDLRTVRSEYEEMKSKFLAEQSVNDKWRLNFESERNQLNNQTISLEASLRQEQQAYHAFDLQSAQIKLKQTLYKDPTYRQTVDQSIKEANKQHKALIKENKMLNQSVTQLSSQRGRFNAIHQVLQAKLGIKAASDQTISEKGGERMVF